MYNCLHITNTACAAMASRHCQTGPASVCCQPDSSSRGFGISSRYPPVGGGQPLLTSAAVKPVAPWSVPQQDQQASWSRLPEGSLLLFITSNLGPLLFCPPPPPHHHPTPPLTHPAAPPPPHTHTHTHPTTTTIPSHPPPQPGPARGA
jgi:hypothetical protein